MYKIHINFNAALNPLNNFVVVNYSYIVVFLIALTLLVIVLVALIVLKNQILKALSKHNETLQNDLRVIVQPKFLEVAVGVEEIVALAIEVWRIEQRISKSAPSLHENQLKGLENSVQKMKRYLEKYDIEIIDYKNQKFNEGLNLDILSVEKDSSISEPVIKETVEPTIMCKGQVVRKAKIILLTNK